MLSVERKTEGMTDDGRDREKREFICHISETTNTYTNSNNDRLTERNKKPSCR